MSKPIHEKAILEGLSDLNWEENGYTVLEDYSKVFATEFKNLPDIAVLAYIQGFHDSLDISSKEVTLKINKERASELLLKTSGNMGMLIGEAASDKISDYKRALKELMTMPLVDGPQILKYLLKWKKENQELWKETEA